MTSTTLPDPYPYEGPEELRAPILAALRRVVDPEMAMTVVDVGLIYGVTVTADSLYVKLTMTSVACPVTDLIIDEVETELDKVAPPQLSIDVGLVWEPPWSPERMSPRGKAFMGW